METKNFTTPPQEQQGMESFARNNPVIDIVRKLKVIYILGVMTVGAWVLFVYGFSKNTEEPVILSVVIPLLSALFIACALIIEKKNREIMAGANLGRKIISCIGILFITVLVAAICYGVVLVIWIGKQGFHG